MTRTSRPALPLEGNVAMAKPSGVLRSFSFAIGLVASISLMLFPFVLHNVPAARLHTGLPVIMLGVAGMLVYGIGYIPDNRALRVFFSPLVAWVLVAAGLFLLLSA